MKAWTNWTDHHRRLAQGARERNEWPGVLAFGLCLGALYAIARYEGWL